MSILFPAPGQKSYRGASHPLGTQALHKSVVLVPLRDSSRLRRQVSKTRRDVSPRGLISSGVSSHPKIRRVGSPSGITSPIAMSPPAIRSAASPQGVISLGARCSPIYSVCWPPGGGSPHRAPSGLGYGCARPDLSRHIYLPLGMCLLKAFTSPVLHQGIFANLVLQVTLLDF